MLLTGMQLFLFGMVVCFCLLSNSHRSDSMGKTDEENSNIFSVI